MVSIEIPTLNSLRRLRLKFFAVSIVLNKKLVHQYFKITAPTNRNQETILKYNMDRLASYTHQRNLFSVNEF